MKEAESEHDLLECKTLKLWNDLTFTTNKKYRDHNQQRMVFGNNGIYSSTAPTLGHRKSQDYYERERLQTTWKNVTALELEGIHWGRLLVMRYQEHEELKRVTAGLMKLQRDFGLEKEALWEKKRKIMTDVQLIGGLIGDQVPSTEACDYLRGASMYLRPYSCT